MKAMFVHGIITLNANGKLRYIDEWTSCNYLFMLPKLQFNFEGCSTSMGYATNILSSCPHSHDACAICVELAKLRHEVKDLREQIVTDYLTGLFNVRHLHYSLELEFERTRRTSNPTSLIMLDIDYFKEVNDTHGHVAGDQVLTELAALIKSIFRKLDICCRYGGEEFAIVLPSTPLLVATQVAERIRLNIDEMSIQLPETEISITASLGVGAYSQNDGMTTKEFVDLVDNQLYRSKAEGRNRVSHIVEVVKTGEVSLEEKAALSGSNRNQ